MSEKLIDYARSSNLKGVEECIKSGININIQNKSGETALMWPSRIGSIDVVKFLIDNAIDINIQNKKGETALLWASRAGHTKIVKFLLSRGADTTNMTIMEWASAGCLEKVKETIVDIPDIDYKSKSVEPLYNSMSALMFASYYGNIEIVKYLVECGADVNIQGDKGIGYHEMGYTAFMLATEKEHLDIVKFLFEIGANINTKNRVGDNALNLASREGYLEIVKYLAGKMEGYLEMAKYLAGNMQTDIFAKHSLFNKAFIDAVENGRIEVVKFFIERGVDINIQDEHGCTALVRASQCNNIETVKFLLENGADINHNGFTALMTASIYRNMKLVKYLLELGANINAQDDKGKTALMWASEGVHYESDEGRLEVVKILVEYGADINIRDRKGNTALMLASDKGDHYIHDVVSFLIKNGATVNNNGSIVLIAAAISGDLERVKYIVENPYLFNVYIKNEKKFNPTALMYASKEGHIEIVKFLVASGADVNLENGEGTTALMFASMNGHIEIVKFLVENGADIKISDMHAKTALKYAKDNGHIEIVKYLKQNGAK